MAPFQQVALRRGWRRRNRRRELVGAWVFSKRVVSYFYPSPPRPAAWLVRAGLAVPADDRVEGAGGDGVEDLRDQAEEAEGGGAVPGGPVAVELGVLCLGQDVEAEPQVLLLSQASHRGRVAVDRELEGGLDLEV